jgi:hypothetical protein
MIATAAAPMAIPPIAPGERLDEWFVVRGTTLAVGVGVAVAVALEEDEEEDDVEVGAELEPVEKGSGVLSDGQASPGSSMKVEFLAISLCTDRVSFAVGLMTPTMP